MNSLMLYLWTVLMLPVAVGLLGFGFHRVALIWRLLGKREPILVHSEDPVEWPTVTAQIPLFNEKYVVERVIRSVASLRYPAGKLHIQVLDDSTDETVEAARALVQELRDQGLKIDYLHRRERTGYKAGALQAGLEAGTGELVAIFDADFLPEPDFLTRMVPAFTDPAVGIVQARWGYLNRTQNFLTRMQAVLMDAHFLVEQAARYRSGLFCNFNGTAGIWRKSCIADSGGWKADTLTEDLDLSYRAQRRGWKFVYRQDVVVPSELPADVGAFKGQQFRWAKGAIETARLQLPTVLRSSLPPSVKWEASMHLAANVSYPLVLLLALALFPLMPDREAYPGLHHFFGWTLGLASICHFGFFSFAIRRAGRSWISVLGYLPGLIIIGVSLAINNTRAVLEAILGFRTPFVRTPKRGDQTRLVEPGQAYLSPESRLLIAEGACLCLCLVLVFRGIGTGEWASIPIFLLFALGFGYGSVVTVMRRAGA